ncbi:head-to-tail adaptor [Mycobacterium phage LittleLaf]|uniref:Head-to-tail adaptor n=12 Tax=Marvinvirus TaxID=1982091 RepID=A0A3S9U938_9CAUD|nr:head-tail adaptor Ad1 [Mycobacterium phage MosMoris]ANM46263.1 hypothetical protein SEA_GATTACA_40 [Mycobacterium phage Gattaca]AVE00786.1 head-to-tail adaptor [Mycobacterium phage Tesla]AYB69847.1 head-to-tail adaptor [Mycobacterium phage LittleLaf]AYB70676.1 head-to-tail adaptor [Mycobacterium phage VasuNzinga]AZF93309.1 head-to-tail adaptor [Mycobacterium phage Beelzebub]AZS06805.1 head-to-tail adaptor [Mycobacterium phage Raela]QAX93092.1 head-to-tail adaptor [Mycobacterium phage RedR
MAWASVEDVRKILPDDEDDIPEEGHVLELVEAYLEEATDVVSSYLGFEYEGEADEDGVPDDVPPRVRRVVARVALRGFIDPAPANAQSETSTMGPFAYHVNWSREATKGDFYLTDTDELRLKPFRRSRSRAAAHVPMWGYC